MAGGGEGEPFWGPVDANINWCEEDYAVTPYVAEFWNSLSSLVLIFFGAYGYHTCRRYGIPLARFSVAFSLVELEGVGSTLFHASMRFHMQLLDEIPMVVGNSALLFISLEDEVKRKWPGPGLPVALAAFAAALTTVYLSFPSLYIIFLFGYSSIVVVLVSLSAQKYRSGRLSPTSRSIFLWSIASYGLGSVLWLSENALCAHIPKWLNLHAWWHLLAGFGTYYFIEFGIAVRADREQRPFRLGTTAIPVPFVEVKIDKSG